MQATASKTKVTRAFVYAQAIRYNWMLAHLSPPHIQPVKNLLARGSAKQNIEGIDYD